MYKVPRGSTMRPASPRTSGLVRLNVRRTLSSRGLAASSSGRSEPSVSVSRDRCRTPARYRPASLRASASMSPISLNRPKQSSCLSVRGTSALCTSAVMTWCSASCDSAGSEANGMRPRVSEARAQHRDAGHPRLPHHRRARHLAAEPPRYPATLFRAARAMNLHVLQLLRRFHQHLRPARRDLQSVLRALHLAVLGEMPEATRDVLAFATKHV